MPSLAAESPPSAAAAKPAVQAARRDISLTQEEKAWLKAHPEIIVAVNHGWAPIGFMSETDELRGISVDYLKKLEAILGVKFRRVRSLEDPSIEKADMFAAVANRKLLASTRFVPLDTPYLDMPFVIFTRNDTENIYSLRYLHGKKVAVFKTGAAAEALAHDHPEIQLYKADIAEEALTALVSGKVDAYIGNLVIVSYVARNQGFGNIRAVGNTPYKASTYMAVRSDWPLLKSILQKGLHAISEEEKNAIYSNWAAISDAREVDYILLLSIGGVALAAITLLGFWNWRLRIIERRRAEQREHARSQVMELLSWAAPLPEILHSIVRGVEQEDHSMLGSILLLDNEGKHLLTGAAPSLPDFYNAAIHGVEIGMGVGSCGTAAFTGERVIVKDIRTHPYWKDYKDLAARAALGACWSEPIKSASGKVIGTFAIYHHYASAPTEYDIHLIELTANLAGMAIDRSRINEELQQALLVYQNSSEAMMVVDADNQIIAVNPAFTMITGYESDEVVGRNPGILKSGRHDEAFYQAMWHEINTSGHWQGETWDRRKNGEVYLKWLTINTVFNADGTVQRRVAMFTDISREREAEQLIWQQANFDLLTGLPNRRMFHDRLDQDIKKAHRASLPLALLFLDLDRFKEVNDTLGHGMGDLLLQEAARRLVNSVRESDTVARLGGDEFTVILGDLDDPGCVDRVAQGILCKLSEPFQLEADVVYISASIGITIYPEDATEIGTLLKNADQAMYAAKQMGRNRYSYFTLSMQQAAQTRMQIANDLRSALAGHQFWIAYQPIVELTSGSIHKAEALLRWQHPTRGLISPAAFIPVAEDTGLIIGIGDWVFREAAQQAQRWRASLHPAFQISINKSPVQFHNAGQTHLAWPHYLKQLGLPGQSITVEITEGLLLDASPLVTDRLLEFRDAGIQVSIDDFGTGYSTLSYLKKFDIDYLKIDQSFIRNLAPGSDDMALCEAIIVMAHKLDMQVIAEGVETEEQKTLLAAAGCDYAQGYLFSRPVPAEEFELLLNRRISAG